MVKYEIAGERKTTKIMTRPETQLYWTEFLETFNRRNRQRPTRIGVYERDHGALTDYWLEDGLPLEGVFAQMRSGTPPTIEIMLGALSERDSGHFTHRVHNVSLVKFVLGVSGDSDGIDVEDDQGTITILRFENSL